MFNYSLYNVNQIIILRSSMWPHAEQARQQSGPQNFSELFELKDELKTRIGNCINVEQLH